MGSIMMLSIGPSWTVRGSRWIWFASISTRAVSPGRKGSAFITTPVRCGIPPIRTPTMVQVEPPMDQAATREIEACRAIATGHEGLDLLVLFGSRARGEARPDSDWDFGYLADERFDPLDLLPPLVTAPGSDRIDLVELRRAGALLRFRAARDGRPIFEARPGRFEELQLEAADFWCDVEPVLRRAYGDLLDELVP